MFITDDPVTCFFCDFIIRKYQQQLSPSHKHGHIKQSITEEYGRQQRDNTLLINKHAGTRHDNLKHHNKGNNYSRATHQHIKSKPYEAYLSFPYHRNLHHHKLNLFNHTDTGNSKTNNIIKTTIYISF